MSQTELTYEKYLNTPSDVQKHLPILRLYAEKSPTIIELGFRGGVSTSALMAAKPKRLQIIDWDKPPFEVNRHRLTTIVHEGYEQGTQVEFKFQDSLEAWPDEAVMLFLDTFHTYEHLFLELIKYSDLILKYMLIHDTDDPTCPGMFCAVEDFLADNPQWELIHRLKDRPGLTVLERVVDCQTFKYSKAFLATLHAEVRAQKEMYYQSIGSVGSLNPQWDEYMQSMRVRFKDARRWPLTNARPGATELMVCDKGTESPRTDR